MATAARRGSSPKGLEVVYDDVDAPLLGYAEKSLLAGLIYLKEDGLAIEKDAG